MGIMYRSSLRSKRGMEKVVKVLLIVAIVMIVLGILLVVISTFMDILQRPSCGFDGCPRQQIREQVLDELSYGRNLSFPESEIKFAVNDSAVIAFGIRNNGSSTSDYCAILTAQYFPKVSNSSLNSSQMTSVPGFQYDDSIQTLRTKEYVVIPVAVFANTSLSMRYTGKVVIVELAQNHTYTDCSRFAPKKNSAPSGVGEVFDTASLGPGDRIYAQKAFFVVVQ